MAKVTRTFRKMKPAFNLYRRTAKTLSRSFSFFSKILMPFTSIIFRLKHTFGMADLPSQSSLPYKFSADFVLVVLGSIIQAESLLLEHPLMKHDVCMYRGRPSWDRAFHLGQGEGPIGIVGSISQPRGIIDTASLMLGHTRALMWIF